MSSRINAYREQEKRAGVAPAWPHVRRRFVAKGSLTHHTYSHAGAYVQTRFSSSVCLALCSAANHRPTSFPVSKINSPCVVGTVMYLLLQYTWHRKFRERCHLHVTFTFSYCAELCNADCRVSARMENAMMQVQRAFYTLDYYLKRGLYFGLRRLFTTVAPPRNAKCAAGSKQPAASLSSGDAVLSFVC